MKEITCFKCELCDEIYEREEEAKSCEGSHRTKLEIFDMKFSSDVSYDYGFPEYLLIEITGHSGCMAEYRMIKDGAVEEFEPYHTSIED